MSWFGPSVLWTTLGALALCLSFATIVGRCMARALPWRVAALARFYLAPAFGLAALVVLATWTSRFFAMNEPIVPLLAALVAALALRIDGNLRQALRHALRVVAFGFACGIPVLVPLLAYGGFNAHNDAFTYLAQSDWLQTHAFEKVPAADVTPVSSQIYIYQTASLRMGGAAFLAFVQALLHIRWAFEAYLGVVLAAVAATCLCVGFAVSRPMASVPRARRLALLMLPAFGFGSLVSATSFGFLPQAFGVLFAAALLFVLGALLDSFAGSHPARSPIVASVPPAFLAAAITYAYPEIGVLVVLAAAAMLALAFARGNGTATTVRFLAALLVGTLVLSNTEIARAIAALRIQAGAVVGGPVDWPALGFLAHAFGVHGGAWDLFQWSRQPFTTAAMAGFVLLSGCVWLVALGVPSLARGRRASSLWAAWFALLAIAAGWLYFRYFVPAPFPQGTGQSWSQFKLTEWAQPFAMVALLAGYVALRKRARRKLDVLVIGVLLVSGAAASYVGIQRLKPVVAAYGGTRDLAAYYRRAREAVLQECPPDRRIYLALDREHLKTRQMLALYLPERDVASDWSGDDVIVQYLPGARQHAVMGSDDCVIEVAADHQQGDAARAFAPYRVVSDTRTLIAIQAVAGTHGRETDGKNTWYWVEQRVDLVLRPYDSAGSAARTRIEFEYSSMVALRLRLSLQLQDGTTRAMDFPSEGRAIQQFRETFDVAPTRIATISIGSDATPMPLSEHDPRRATWMLRNVRVRLVPS